MRESKIKPAGKASLNYDGKDYEFPVFSGTQGPNVVDIRKLYDQADIFTYDPGFTSTALDRMQHHLHRWRQGRAAISRLSDRGAGRTFQLPGDLLSAAVRRIAEQEPDGEIRATPSPITPWCMSSWRASSAASAATPIRWRSCAAWSARCRPSITTAPTSTIPASARSPATG